MMKTKFDVVAVVLISMACVAPVAFAFGAKNKQPAVNTATLLKREEQMVLNLQNGPKSTKFFILQSLRQTRDMQKNLDRAIRQVEQVDANYAKAHNRPDDRTMGSTVARLKQAMQTADQLEKQLEDANTELKSDVQQTLIRQ